MEHLWIPLAAFVTTIVFHLFALKVFPKLQLLDFPERYGLSRQKLPYPTGILAIGVFLIFFALLEHSIQSFGLMLAIILLSITSFIDDRYRISPWLRLSIQACCAIVIFATGTRIYTITNPLDDLTGIPFIKLDTIDIPINFSLFQYFNISTLLPLWSGVFTLIWLMITMNALNWFDGISGQVSVVSFLGFTVIGLLSLSDRVNQPSLALVALILAGIALGCLLFDFPPPKVLMGDTGAMFFGLMLGVLTIYAGGKVATAFLVLGVPLIDFGIVILRRIVKGHSIFKGNTTDEHLHHRLLSKGWKPGSIILLTAAIGTCFGVAALFLSTTEKFIAAVILLCVTIGLSIYSGRNVQNN